MPSPNCWKDALAGFLRESTFHLLPYTMEWSLKRPPTFFSFPTQHPSASIHCPVPWNRIFISVCPLCCCDVPSIYSFTPGQFSSLPERFSLFQYLLLLDLLFSPTRLQFCTVVVLWCVCDFCSSSSTVQVEAGCSIPLWQAGKLRIVLRGAGGSVSQLPGRDIGLTANSASITKCPSMWFFLTLFRCLS